MVSRLKSINRTLLEMWTGMLFLGLVLSIAGFGLQKASGGWGIYSKSLWLGIFLAVISSVHIYRTLDKGLSLDAKHAQKKIFMGYVFRYAAFVLILGAIMIQARECPPGYFNPLVVFMGYMTLKVTALIQPFTHKLYNKIFHEADPMPQPVEDVVKGEDENSSGIQSKT